MFRIFDENGQPWRPKKLLLLRFSNGQRATVEETYFRGYPDEIRAHGMEGLSYIGRPTLRTFRKAGEDDTHVIYDEVLEQ